MRRESLCALALLAAVAMPTGGHAGVNIDIGIHFPGPPALVPVPASPVMYAPQGPANYFAYGGQYYVFTGGAWYLSSGYDGPWVVVAPEFVPRPLLIVPVRYYHVPPPAWVHWRREAAPHWEPRWGRHWEEHGPSRGHDHGNRYAHHHGEKRDRD